MWTSFMDLQFTSTGASGAYKTSIQAGCTAVETENLEYLGLLNLGDLRLDSQLTLGHKMNVVSKPIMHGLACCGSRLCIWFLCHTSFRT